MLNDMKIASRLGLLLALPVACMFAVGAIGLAGGRAMLADVRMVYEDDTQNLRRLGIASTNVVRARADAANGLLDPAADAAKKHADKILNKINEINSSWVQYAGNIRDAEERSQADQVAAAIQNLTAQGLAPMVAALQSGSTEEAKRIYWEQVEKHYPVARDRLIALEELQVSNAGAHYASSLEDSRLNTVFLAGTLLATVCLVLVTGVPVVRSITRRVTAMRDAMHEAQRGNDLTLRLPVRGNDEIAATSNAFNALMGSMQDSFRTLTGSANEVSGAARSVAAASAQISETSLAQAESAASTAAAVEEVTVSISQVAENTAETRAVASKSSELSAEGEKVALAAARQMATTADSVAESARMIESLSQRSSEISGIVKVISDIAEQTNLLALNAAIEAARAGEQGRGFAVVADEVRKLAERTSSSTSEISGMIEAIQNEVHSAVGSLKLNNDQVIEGREQARTVAGILSSIHAGSARTMARIQDISQAATEQSGASNEIARSFEKIAQSAEETSAAIGQASQAAVDLDRLAAGLHAEIARFRT